MSVVAAILKRMNEELSGKETAEVIRAALPLLSDELQVRLLADHFKENDHLIDEIVELMNQEA